MPSFPEPIIASDTTGRSRRGLLVKTLFALNIVALIIASLAWALNEMYGYSARIVVNDRAWVLDVCLGEIALWTGPISRGATTQPILMAPAVAGPTATTTPATLPAPPAR